MNWKGIGLFALGTLFGLEGIKLLTSKDAKKLYTHCTAGVLRAKDSVVTQVTTLQENCADIYAEAKAINEERAKKEKETEVDDDDTKVADAETADRETTDAEAADAKSTDTEDENKNDSEITDTKTADSKDEEE